MLDFEIATENTFDATNHKLIASDNIHAEIIGDKKDSLVNQTSKSHKKEKSEKM